jgi:hypothetical protein
MQDKNVFCLLPSAALDIDVEMHIKRRMGYLFPQIKWRLWGFMGVFEKVVYGDVEIGCVELRKQQCQYHMVLRCGSAALREYA